MLTQETAGQDAAEVEVAPTLGEEGRSGEAHENRGGGKQSGDKDGRIDGQHQLYQGAQRKTLHNKKRAEEERKKKNVKRMRSVGS